jgi:hypothetical protein
VKKKSQNVELHSVGKKKKKEEEERRRKKKKKKDTGLSNVHSYLLNYQHK